MITASSADCPMNSGEVLEMSTAIDSTSDGIIQQALLEHVARYRMTVLPAVQGLPAFANFGRKRTITFLRQLCRTHDLGDASLYHNRRYYHLGHRGGQACPQTDPAIDGDHLHGPLSEPAKIRDYAILVFCCLGDARRQRLTVGDLKVHFPDLFRPGLVMNYYIDTSAAQPRMGFLRVDIGGHGRWDRVLAKCRRDLESHWAHAGFRPFIARDAFEISLITALPQKARRLAESLTAWGDPRARMIKVCAIPELINLIAPPPT